MLIRGRDYLFFDHVDCSQHAVTDGMTRGAAIMTPNLIAMIPWQVTGSVVIATTVTEISGTDPVRAMRTLLGDPDLDLGRLEASLQMMYGAMGCVFPIADLDGFKITTGFFGMVTLKKRGEPVRRLVIRDRGGKLLAKEFFAARSRPTPGAAAKSCTHAVTL